MRKTFWLAYNTALQIFRERILYTAIFFSVVLIFVGGVLDTATPQQRGMVLVDIGLAAIELFGVLIAIVMGVNLLHQELDRKTVYNVLSKPLTRPQFVVGKYFGQVTAVWSVVAAMMLCMLIVMSFFEVAPTPILWMALWMILLELALLGAIAVLFSSFSTPYLSGLFTFGLWLVGSASDAIFNVQMIANLRRLGPLVEAAFLLLPGFSKLNLKNRVPYDLMPPAGYVWQHTLYVVLYTSAVVLFSIGIFKRRDFK